MSDEKTDQKERFKRTAREHGVELDEKKLAETLRRIAKKKKDKQTKEGRN